MRKCVIALVVCFLGMGASLQAAVVYLKTGEALRGTVLNIDEQNLSLESEQGFGVLQINRVDILSIEFETVTPDIKYRSGIGYSYRSTAIQGNAAIQPYSVGSLSYKNWFAPDQNLEILFGLSDSRHREEERLRVIDLEGRYAKVVKQTGQAYAYVGGGIGLLSVTDVSRKIKGSQSLHVNGFIGVEVFPTSLPNLSFSGEMGLLYQKPGSETHISFFGVGFPSMSVHYYF